VNNPVYLIRDGELITLAPNKHYLGNQVKESDFSFTHMEVKPDDKFYLFSDGYADQFGGAKGKKMGYKNFRNFLLSISHLPMDQQHLQLILKFEEWKGDIEQTDDMLLIGLNFK
jgi:serine phosphatase RsbU (regulator of sigma subunit)